jgi:two-component system nitrate/nitrite sensor histidine kinase NarX
MTSAIEASPSSVIAGAGILGALASNLAGESNLPELLKRFLVPLLQVSGAEAGAVRSVSGAGDQLHLISSIGLPEEMARAEATVQAHCGACGAAASGETPTWANEAAGCARLRPAGHAGVDFRRMVAVPLRHRGQVLGVYNLFYAQRPTPGPEVLAVLKAVGELLGLALNNARLETEKLQARLTQERQRMAAEVHDSLAQSLAFAKMRMPLLHDAMLAHDDARAQQYYDDVRHAMTEAHASLRGILTNFRTPMDPQGLVHALGASAENFRRSTGTELDFVNELPGLKLPAEMEAQVFHIVQEALTNVARHAHAQHAQLRIAGARPGEVEIVVEDDGAGLPPTAGGSTHYGMEIMVERARRLAGALEVGARQGGGTRVRLTFPVHELEAAVAAATAA